MTRDEKLAHFQAVLLDVLAEPLAAEEILARLRGDETIREFHAYIAGFEPRMVEVAAELVKKWGARQEKEKNPADC
jgi:hypothetical protein